MSFFYYRKNFASKWIPVKDTQRPMKVAEGSPPKYTGLVELTEGYDELTLDELVEQHPIPDDAPTLTTPPEEETEQEASNETG